MRVSAMEIVRHSDGAYVRLQMAIACAEPGRAVSAKAELDYRLFFDVDPQHRGLLHFGAGEGPGMTAGDRPLILSASDHRISISLDPGAARAVATFRSFVAAGARHIAGV